MNECSTGATVRRSRWRALTATSTVALLGAALFMVLFTFMAYGQNTGAGLAVRPDFPPAVTVGQKAVPVDLVIQNTSQHGQGKVTFIPGAITLTPSCGSLPPGAAEPCPNPDAGVFATSATGTGRAGTNCAGAAFTIAPAAGSNAGEVQFNGPGIVLDATDANDNNGGKCIIDFTVDVLKAPALDAQPATAGVQTAQLANAVGTTDLNLPAGCCGSSVTTVAPATPALTTQASPPVTLGGQITDTANLTGGITPTGTVTFKFFPPADTNCAGPPVFTSPPVAVTGPGSYTSAPYTPTVTGTFRTIAVYSGNTNNAAVITKCNDNGESVVVSAVAPKVVAPTPTPSTSVLGASISRKPILPVTGPDVPVGPLGLLGLVLVAAGALLLRRRRSGAA